MNNIDIITKQEIQGLLRSLRSYYSERAKASVKIEQNTSVDYKVLSELFISAARWQAKHDAIQVVADRLEISLEDINAKGDALTTDNYEYLLMSFLQKGLHSEDSHQKQYALCKVSEMLGLKDLLEGVENRGIV